MMAEEPRRCGKCGLLCAADWSFCQKCGAELAGGTDSSSLSQAPPAQGAPAQETAPTKNLTPPLSVQAPDPQPVVVPDPPSESAAEAGHPEPMPEREASFQPRDDGDHDARTQAMIVSRRESRCVDIDVLYNAARVFVEGLIMPFEFRITPRIEGIEELFIEIRCNHQVVARMVLDEELGEADEVAVDLPFSPWVGLSGKVPFQIWIGYALEGTPRHYLLRKTHTCFRRTEPMGNVIKQLKVELINNIEAGNASDPVVNMKVGGLDKIIPRPNDPAEEFRHVDIPDIWERVALRTARYKPAEGSFGLAPGSTPPAAARTDALTLVGTGGRIHVLHCPQAVSGRNRSASTIVCRLPWDGKPTDPRNPNLCISKRHALFERSSDRWSVRDGGWDKDAGAWAPSRQGLFVDGKRVPAGQALDLPPDTPFVVSFSSPRSDDKSVFSFDGCVRSATAAAREVPGCREHTVVHGPAALVLRSRQGPRETFVLVHGMVPLKFIDPAFPEGCLCRCGGGFLLRAGKQCDWLQPGMTAWVGGQGMTVSGYRKR